MPIVTLSANFVRTSQCPPGRKKIDFFDADQRGFLLEVRSTGGRTYYQRYTDERGRTHQFKIGPAPLIGLEAARRRARQILAEALLGGSPQADRAERRQIPTLAEFVRDRYLPFVRSYKRSWQTDETVLRVHILPTLGKHPLDRITTEEISNLVNTMREMGYAPGTMNRVLVILRYAFNLAKKWKVIRLPENPAAGLTAGPDVQRSRVLDEEEVKRLVDSLAADENQSAAQAILLLLLTGARRNEVTHARWEYVDWTKRTLLVPRSKSGKPRLISLNGAALTLLQRWPRQEGNPYIFPSTATGRPPASLFFPWDRIRKRAGLEDVRLHDLRHSFASFLVNRGISLYVVQGLLGHAHARTTQRYAHLVADTLSDAAELMVDIVPVDSATAQRVITPK